MKRIIALILSCCLLFSACSADTKSETASVSKAISHTESTVSSGIVSSENLESAVASLEDFQTVLPEYNSLSDPDLIRCVEDSVYAELVENLEGDYFVEDVSAVYVSKEYLEEVSYNSQQNIFFGYTLSELDEQFQGTRYVFTLGDDGTTTVEPFEEYDDTYERAIKNTLIGSGVIFLCVTVSAVSGGLGAPAVSMIFAASAKTGSIMALSSGGLGAVGSAVITGIQTKDFDKALKAAALNGSEGFKWGAISGALSGGISETAALKGAALNGLTMNEAAAIQKESKYPLDVIKEFKSMDEYQVYKKAGLTAKQIGGKTSLVRDIDLKYESNLGGKTVTNLERMQKGHPPVDPATGQSYQLHHINQNAEGTLAILKIDEHLGNARILNSEGAAKQITEVAWAKQKRDYWKAFAASFGGR